MEKTDYKNKVMSLIKKCPTIKKRYKQIMLDFYINERKIEEEKLKQSNKKLRKIINNYKKIIKI